MILRANLLLVSAIWIAPDLAAAQTSVHDFELGGSAAIVSEDCIRLTPDQPYVSGSAWFRTAIDLKRPFEMHLSLVLGKKDIDGADGIVFVFHPTARTGRRGEGMGFAGLVPSVGIEFDTYRNVHLNDPVSDHLALMANGRRYHGEGGLPPVSLGNLEDGARHPLAIRWAGEGGRLDVELDGETKASYSADAIVQVFGAQSMVYWGMTAGTGRLSNVQDVCLEKLFLAHR